MKGLTPFPLKTTLRIFLGLALGLALGPGTGGDAHAASYYFGQFSFSLNVPDSPDAIVDEDSYANIAVAKLRTLVQSEGIAPETVFLLPPTSLVDTQTGKIEYTFGILSPSPSHKLARKLGTVRVDVNLGPFGTLETTLPIDQVRFPKLPKDHDAYTPAEAAITWAGARRLRQVLRDEGLGVYRENVDFISVSIPGVPTSREIIATEDDARYLLHGFNFLQACRYLLRRGLGRTE